MEDVDVPHPNPFITQWLVGARCRSIVFEVGELYEALYREVVAKRTGRLAASTHVFTGIEDGRWVGHMTVTAPYAASHEWGVDDGAERITAGAHDLTAIRDLNNALNLMGSL